MASNQSVAAAGPGLKRVLGLPALVLYGIILIQPTAPMPLFGALYRAWRTSWFRRRMDFARIASDEEPAPAANSPEPAKQ